MNPKVIIYILLVLCGSGAGLYFLGFLPFVSGEQQTSAPGDDMSPIYMPLEPPFVVNFTHRGTLRYLQVSLELMYYDQSLLDRVNEHMPAIRNELILLFSDQEYEQLSTQEGKQKLRSDIIAAVNALIDNEGNSEDTGAVYLTSFVMQ